jgi:hypothetical protein
MTLEAPLAQVYDAVQLNRRWWHRLLPFPDMVQAFARFPAPVLVAAAAALTVVGDELNLPVVSHVDEDWLEAALLLFFTSLLPSLFFEARAFPRLISGLSGLAGLALAMCWWLLPPGWGPGVNGAAVMAGIGMAMLCGIAAFRIRTSNLDPFWIWHQRVFLHGIFAVVGAGLLVLGLLAIDRSLDLLFGIDLNSLVTEIIIPVVFLFLVPVSWLAAIAPVSDLPDRVGAEDTIILKGISLITRFIAVPLLAVYAALLIAYAAKIALDGTLPQNQVGWMVTAFGTTGAAAILALYPDRHGGNGFVRLFWRYWFPVTLLPLGLLGIAIWERVSAYGLTEERVLLVGGFVWLIILALSYTVLRGARDIRLISGLAGLMLLVFSVGPFNLQALSIQSQAGRLIEAAEKLTADASDEVSGHVMKGALDYLRRHDVPDAVVKLATARGFSPDEEGKADTAAIQNFLTQEFGLDRIAKQITAPRSISIGLEQGRVDLGAGLDLHGPFMLQASSDRMKATVGGIELSLSGPTLIVKDGAAEIVLDYAALFEAEPFRNRPLDRMTRRVSWVQGTSRSSFKMV